MIKGIKIRSLLWLNRREAPSATLCSSGARTKPRTMQSVFKFINIYINITVSYWFFKIKLYVYLSTVRIH